MAHAMILAVDKVERADGLCPTCFLPRLIRITFRVIYSGGASALTERIRCKECRVIVEEPI